MASAQSTSTPSCKHRLQQTRVDKLPVGPPRDSAVTGGMYCCSSLHFSVAIQPSERCSVPPLIAAVISRHQWTCATTNATLHFTADVKCVRKGWEKGYHTHTYRQTDRQTHTHIHPPTPTHTPIHPPTHTHTHTHTHTSTHTYTHTYTHTPTVKEKIYCKLKAKYLLINVCT